MDETTVRSDRRQWCPMPATGRPPASRNDACAWPFRRSRSERVGGSRSGISPHADLAETMRHEQPGPHPD